jgi:hypothetical protein
LILPNLGPPGTGGPFSSAGLKIKNEQGTIVNAPERNSCPKCLCIQSVAIHDGADRAGAPRFSAGFESAGQGPPQVLRALVLMQVKNWNYRELRERIADE